MYPKYLFLREIVTFIKIDLHMSKKSCNFAANYQNSRYYGKGTIN